MKLLEFKNYISERLSILKINIINSYQIETAYFSQGWGNVLSTVFWTLTYLVFLNVIFSNVKSFAGYGRNEIFFLTLVGQVTFYMVWMWGLENVGDLVEGINTGQLDLILTKPIPALFYISVKNINLVNFLRDGVPSLSILVLVIDWSSLSFNIFNVISGILIFIFGQICAQSFIFIFSLTAFWTGNGYNTFWIGFDILDALNNIPFDGLSMKLKIIFTSVLPAAISTGVTASVLLGKSNNVKMLLLSIAAASVFSIIKILSWNFALKHYSSASS